MRIRSGIRAMAAAGALAAWLGVAFAGEDPAPAGKAPPSCDGEAYRQFDFWIGSWTVTEGGQPAGRNRIEADLKHCALFESWTSVDGGRGRSINFFDRNKRQWHQSWIDDRGGALQLDGGLLAGAMVLEGERLDPGSGKTARHRITWTPQPDGSVRQHWEVMKTPGAAWESVFDGIYRRTP